MKKYFVLFLISAAFSGCRTFGVVKKSTCQDLFEDYANCEIVKQ